jgi:hypothetical protein
MVRHLLVICAGEYEEYVIRGVITVLSPDLPFSGKDWIDKKQQEFAAIHCPDNCLEPKRGRRYAKWNEGTKNYNTEFSWFCHAYPYTCFIKWLESLPEVEITPHEEVDVTH